MFFYCDIYSTALSAISKYRSGKVGMSFDFYETVPGDLAVTYKGEFGFGKKFTRDSNRWRLLYLRQL